MKSKLIVIFFLSAIFFNSCSKDEPGPDNNNNPIQEIPIDLDQFAREHKGFNLLGKFDASWSNNGFTEEEFIIIQDLGFNFVRLPLDYRTYTKAGDWNTFLENGIVNIDHAIEWGIQYGVHVCINLHRAPGYCVNETTLPANQDLDLWTDPLAQDAFVDHWTYFANRYKDYSYNDVSFNLVNEPGDMNEATYINIMQKAIDAIHDINPNRIIFVDGLNYGRDLMMSLKGAKNIIQAIHVYDPFNLTHYKASWVNGSDTWPVPIWPITNISNYLYGPWKSEYESSLILEGDFPQGATLTINVQQVSVESTLQIKLDDVEIYSKSFICGPDLGEDWTVINQTQWGYQNISGKDYSVSLPSDGLKLTLSNTAGDWLTMNRITLSLGGSEVTIVPGNTGWGSIQKTYKITTEGEITEEDGRPVLALGSLQETLDLGISESIPIMVQEFGVYNQTPHTVTLDYLTDVVALFNTYNVGYTLWNLSGSFGILNSGRTDCTYTSYRGNQLDQAMADILTGN